MAGTAQVISQPITDAYLAQIFSLVREDYRPKREETVLKDRPFLQRNWKNREKSSAVSIIQTLQTSQFGGSTFFKQMQGTVNQYNQVLQRAVLHYANAITPIILPWDDAIAAGDGSPAETSKLASTLSDVAGEAHGELLGNSIYYDATSTNNPSGSAAGSSDFALGFNGLAEICPATASDTTYAGLSSATYTGWKNQYSTATVCSIGNVEALWGLVRTKGRANPTLGLTNQTNWDRLFNQNQPAQLLQVMSKQTVGYTALVLQNMEIMVDFHCPSKAYNDATLTYGASTVTNQLVPSSASQEFFYVLDESKFALVVHKQGDMFTRPFEYTGMTGSEGYRSAIVTRANIVCTNRRACGVAVYTS